MKSGAGLLLALLCLYALCSCCRAEQRVLVLLEDLKLKNSHSNFLGGVAARGYRLDYRRIDSKALQLRQWDDWLYEHIVILASSTAPGGAVDAAALLEFVNSGRNVLVAVDPKVSDEIREFVTECGIDLEAPGAYVIDHFKYVTAEEPDHTLFATTGVLEAPAVFGSQRLQDPIVYRGLGMSVPPESELVATLLTAENTSFSHSPYKALPDGVVAAGKDLGLVAILQARNNARVVVAGSIDMFSNTFFRRAQAGNAHMCTRLAQWAFQEVGVLRAHNLRHHLVGEAEAPPVYRIKDRVHVSIDIQERHLDSWQPFRAEDVQLEFVMLDPYIRTTLQHDNKGTFHTTFTVPDVYGVFKFVLQYKRLGYSYLELSEQVPVRPFRHNEYERFLPAAYPYYSSVFSLMAGFFLLVILVLYHK